MNCLSIIFTISVIALIIYMLRRWDKELPKKNYNPFNQITSIDSSSYDYLLGEHVKTFLKEKDEKNITQKDK